MARPVDPNAQYQVKPHTTKGYVYASTQPPYIDPQTGKKKYRYVHWGTLDENLKFTPGSAFYMAEPEERKRLMFPLDWDISEAQKLTGLRNLDYLDNTGESYNRLYGDIWFLEQVASKTGIRQDLESVFSGNVSVK